MAEFDYAFLADFAQVSDGKLTAVGGSFTFVRAAELPMGLRTAIAGRLRVPVTADSVAVKVQIVPPDRQYDLAIEGQIVPGGERAAYRDGLQGILFALNFEIPIPVAGLYEVLLEVDGLRVRRLAFEARHGD